MRVTALDAAGAPDVAFGNGGIAASPPAKANSAVVTTILPQPDGSLVAGGDLATFSPKVSPTNFAVVAMRFGGDGSPGPRLGEVFTDREVVGLADLVPQGDAFVAVGTLTDLFEPFGFLARFSDSAFPYDPGFGGGVGLVTLGPFSESGGDVPFSAAAAAGEGLIVAGRAGGRILLARYQADGILDTGFGEAGLTRTSIPIDGLRSVGSTDIVVQPDGKSVVGGVVSVSRKAFCDSQAAACWHPFLARFQPDGQLDAGFGDGGFVFGPLREAQAGGGFDLALQPDGKILFSHSVVGGSTLGVARYNANGSIDGSFGEGGEAGVLPCQGKLAQRRRSGCLSSTAVRLRAHGLRHGRPASRFSIQVSNPLDPVAAVKLVLPPELEGRRGTAGKVRVLTGFRHRARIKVRPRVVFVSRLGNARGIHVAVDAGVLHRVAPVAPGKKLRFRVEVKLKDETRKMFSFRSSR
ncbi:MAG: delta-60 repeat domain-containing protein [Chloroflexota bacterium]